MSAQTQIFCPDCGFRNDADARFCQQCGRQLGDVHEASAAASPITVGDEKDATGRLIGSDGRPIPDAFDVSDEERVLWEGRPSLLWSPRMSLTQRYRLTNHRLVLTFGFIGRRTEEIELYRITDVGVKQHPLERITRIGDVYVASGDRSSPVKYLHNVKTPDRVKDLVRESSRAERDRRRVLMREEF